MEWTPNSFSDVLHAERRIKRLNGSPGLLGDLALAAAIDAGRLGPSGMVQAWSGPPRPDRTGSLSPSTSPSRPGSTMTRSQDARQDRVDLQLPPQLVEQVGAAVGSGADEGRFRARGEAHPKRSLARPPKAYGLAPVT